MKHVIVVLLVFSAIGGPLPAQEEPVRAQTERTENKEMRDLSERAQRAESKGDRAEAIKAYEALRSQVTLPAGETGADAARIRIDATFQSARNLEAIALADPARAATLAQARVRYEEVITQGDATQKLAARNALGVLLLRQGQKAEALAALKQIDLTTVPPTQAFVFHSNLGRAFEENDQGERAFTEYKAALEDQASFAPAQQGAFRVLQRRTPLASAEVIGLIELLTKKGEVRAAAERTRELLVAWAGQPAAAELLPQLAGSYQAARMAPADFVQREWPELAKVTDAALRVPLDQLRHAYQDDFAVPPGRGRRPQDFAAWADLGSRARAMAALLRFLGNLENTAERPRRALARYWTAWLLDRDPDYAVATLSVLEAHPDLQPEPPRVLDGLIATLFQTKGDAYARQDWPSIMRLHVILAGIFERQTHWGPEFGAKGAVFQWEHAARAAAAARREHPDIGPTPGIHLSLAECYRRLDRLADAWKEYVQAAEGFLADRRPADARKAVAACASLGWQPSATADQVRFKKLEADIAAHEP